MVNGEEERGVAPSVRFGDVEAAKPIRWESVHRGWVFRHHYWGTGRVSWKCESTTRFQYVIKTEAIIIGQSRTATAVVVGNGQSKPKPISRQHNAAEAPERCCFNCSKFRHMKPKCSYEKRAINSCFRCYDQGLTRQDCPNPEKIPKRITTKTPRTAAAVQRADDTAAIEEQEIMNETNPVSVAFLLLRPQDQSLLSLFRFLIRAVRLASFNDQRCHTRIPVLHNPHNYMAWEENKLQYWAKSTAKYASETKLKTSNFWFCRIMLLEYV